MRYVPAFILVSALGLAVLSPAARAEVLDAAPAGFTVENSGVVPVDAGAAWAALVGQVDAWWPKDHSWWGAEGRLSIEPRVGGCFCEVAGDRQAEHLRVVFVDPGRRLRMSGGLGPLQGMGLDGILEFRLEPADSGDGAATRITLHYRVGGYSPDDIGQFAPVVDRVQAAQLGGLLAHLGADDGDGPTATGSPRAQ
ncbi:SRPBCC domain-containing protein [Luteimonas composti]|uniref:SRPBCC domain-containing protein n=1 Tax=Luteimonas composti TaxID=398257 RepID=A0ABT6MUE8_9GAMM|nr:SRPBCC domain-containing protein [Luteimonas composti]MDH7453925.1 SRPBCC domain-containing protein [Luteimonas composti]